MTHKIGDLVVISETYARPQDRGVVYRVKDILKVNIVVEPIKGGRNMRGRPELFEAAAPEGTEAQVVGIPYVAPLNCGEVVTIAGPTWKQPADLFYVVLSESRSRVKVARLGGDGGRYWTSIPRGMVTVVDPKRIVVE